MRTPSTASLRYFALLLGTVGLLWSAKVFAVSPLQWGDPGLPIRQGHHIEWARSAYRTDVDSLGFTIMTWSDTRTGDRDVYAQLVRPDGSLAPGWPVNVVTYPFRQEDPEPIAVVGGLIIAWIDFRFDSTGDVFAQKFDYNGNRLWNPEGVLVDTFVRENNSMVNETTLRAAHDGAGGAIIAWEDNRNNDNADIYAQRVLANGTRGWANVLPVTSHPGVQTGITADTDGQGNMILAWVDTRTNEENLYTAKIMADRSLPWGGTGGTILCDATLRQTSVKICPDLTTGGAYYAWSDERDGLASNELYSQRFNANGTPAWQANGIVLCNAPDNQSGVRVAVSINDGAQDGVIYCWDDLRTNASISEIYSQKANPQGVHQWQTNGVKVCGNAVVGGGGQTRDNSRLTSDYDGGAMVVWDDTRATGLVTQYDLYLGRVDASGVLPCGDSGQLILGGPNEQQEAVLRADGDGTHVLCIFRDFSRGSSTLRIALSRVSNCVTEQMNEIIYGLDGDATNPSNVQMFHGNVGYVWEDNRGRNFGKQVYYQVLDTITTGAPVRVHPDVIPVNGAPIAPDNGGLPRYVQETPQVCTDNSHGFFCSFTDNREGTKQIRLQRVGYAGDLVCAATGVLVAPTGPGLDQENAQIVSDGQNGCYVVWSGYDDAFVLDVFAMRMDDNCQQVWTEAVVLSDNADDDDLLMGIAVDDNGCLGAVWQTLGFGQYDIWGAKVCGDGTVAWRDSVGAAPREQSDAQIISDGQGGFYFAWADGRAEGSGKDIYAQRFDANGERPAGWTSGLGKLVVTAPNDQKVPRLATDSQHNLYVIWQDFRTGIHLDLYGQKMDPAGTKLWQPDLTGRPICTVVGDQGDQQLLVEWSDGIYIAWVDQRTSFDDIMGVHYDAAGNIIDTDWWGTVGDADGGPINDQYQKQTQPALAHDFHGGTMAVWVDWRSSGKEPLQNIWGNWVNDGTVSVRELPAPLPREYMLTQNFPNPFNPTTEFRFTIPATEAVKITVFNTLGQQVETLLDEVMHAGTYNVTFDASALASGIYFYRLATPSFETVKKMQLIK
jgi:hypothetical protein